MVSVRGKRGEGGWGRRRLDTVLWRRGAVDDGRVIAARAGGWQLRMHDGSRGVVGWLHERGKVKVEGGAVDGG